MFICVRSAGNVVESSTADEGLFVAPADAKLIVVGRFGTYFFRFLLSICFVSFPSSQGGADLLLLKFFDGIFPAHISNCSMAKITKKLCSLRPPNIKQITQRKCQTDEQKQRNNFVSFFTVFFNPKPYYQTCYTKRQGIYDIGIINPYPTHSNEPNSEQYCNDKENVVSYYFHFTSLPVLSM